MRSPPSWSSSWRPESRSPRCGCVTASAGANATCSSPQRQICERDRRSGAHMTDEVLGIDVGGSSVKAGLVDVQRGTVSGALISAPTPRPCTPASLMPVLAALAGRLAGASGRAGVAFPSVIKGGTAYTAANVDACWIGANGATLAAEALGRPVLMLNDADAAGIAEMRFGSGQGCTGKIGRAS